MKQLCLILTLLLLGSCATQQIKKNENYYNKFFCHKLKGKTESKHYYNYANHRSYILIDCETKTRVYEGGLDKRSSLDSVQQAIFAAFLTNKEAVVVIYDTDGKLGKYEHRIQTVAQNLGIRFLSYHVQE